MSSKQNVSGWRLLIQHNFFPSLLILFDAISRSLTLWLPNVHYMRIPLNEEEKSTVHNNHAVIRKPLN